VWLELRGRRETNQRVRRVLRLPRSHRGLYGRRVVSQLIDGAAVGEGVNPGPAIGMPHELRLAGAVIDTLQGVGQRRPLETGWIGEHVGGSRASEFHVVERELKLG
jgi:hypothetical protein